METMTKRNACRERLPVLLIALAVLAGFQPGFAEISDQEAEKELGQLKAMVEAMSPQDLEKIWEKARQGDAKTQFLLGGMYKWGLRVPKDLTEAAEWYRLAAEQGHAQAQVGLGWMYDKGEGVLENSQEAAKWYRLAANQGNANAQNNLALLCLQSVMAALTGGKGSLWKRGSLKCDNAEAYAWLVLSAAQGNKAAAKNKELFKRQGVFAQDVIKGQRLARKLLKRIESSKSP